MVTKLSIAQFTVAINLPLHLDVNGFQFCTMNIQTVVNCTTLVCSLNRFLNCLMIFL